MAASEEQFIQEQMALLKEREDEAIKAVKESFRLERQTLVAKQRKIVRQRRKENWQAFLSEGLENINTQWLHRIQFRSSVQSDQMPRSTTHLMGGIRTDWKEVELPSLGKVNARLVLTTGYLVTLHKAGIDISLEVVDQTDVQVHTLGLYDEFPRKDWRRSSKAALAKWLEDTKMGKLPSIS